jgi:hypothetical protein
MRDEEQSGDASHSEENMGEGVCFHMIHILLAIGTFVKKF